MITFNAAISACGKCYLLEEALYLFFEVQQYRLEPDLITCNSAISACERCQQWAQALRLLV